MNINKLENIVNNKDIIQTCCFINGNWNNFSQRDKIEIINPATAKLLATVPNCTYEDALETIQIANDAWPIWRKMLAKDRAKILNKWARKLRNNEHDIAIIMTMEMGKPITQSRGEIRYAARFIEWYAAQASRCFGETIPQTKTGRREITWKEPVGVSAAITPWNFPAAMVARKLAPALAAGCPTILKPAEASPLTALAMAKCASDAGMPAGILNVITGDAAAIGKAFTESSIVRKLSFTGSTEIGKMLYAQCANTVKKISLELGGNAPFIIFADADLKAAMKGLEIAKFRNSGQTCVCANRVFVSADIYDKCRDKILKLASKVKVGSPEEEGTDIGCLINKEAFDRTKQLIADAMQNGAKLLLGGDAPDGLNAPFFAPTVLDNVTNDMAIAQQEIFAPVISIIKFHSEQEVIQQANATNYGLAAYFYTQDYKRIFRVSEALEYGMVGANLGHVSSISSPFGGYKESGIGREASTYGIEEFLETKYLAIGGLD